MSKYTVSFQSVDFGRRVEMALYDNERRAFIYAPRLEYTPQGRHFMAGSPQEFKEFVEAIVQAWNEYAAEVRRKTGDVAELYADDFMEGFNEGRPLEASDSVPDEPDRSRRGASDEGDEGAADHREVRPRR